MTLTSVIAGVLSIVLTCHSMARSEIWDKFHLCCSENGKLHSASPRAIFAILTTTLVKFIPNFTPSHAITYTNTLLM